MANLLTFLSKTMTIQTENLATEALTYILQNSPDARRAFIKLLNNVEPQLSSDLYFQNQVYDTDNSIPDMIGYDASHTPVCIIEAKFWAGLTRNQPCTYIDRLPQIAPSLLLFIAPDKRLDTLWWEVKERASNELTLGTEDNQDDIRFIEMSENRKMAVVSWSLLLWSILSYFQHH